MVLSLDFGPVAALLSGLNDVGLEIGQAGA